MNSRFIQKAKLRRGFSLIELLMALAVVSMLAAVAVFNLTNVIGAGKDAASLRNAREFCNLYHSARAAGAKFTAGTKEGIFEELRQGKTGVGIFSKSTFILNLADSEKDEALELCSYDAAGETLSFRSRAAD